MAGHEIYGSKVIKCFPLFLIKNIHINIVINRTDRSKRRTAAANQDMLVKSIDI